MIKTAFPPGILLFSLTAVLAVIYLLSFRRKKKVIPSILLWDSRSTLQSGKSLKIRKPEKLFYLEALIIAVLAAACSEPFITVSSKTRIILILDNSFSMQAVSSDDNLSSLDRGMRRLKKYTGENSEYEIDRVILAGRKPSLLNTHALSDLSSYWNGREVSFDIQAALELSGYQDKKMPAVVITDHIPQYIPEMVVWESVGKELKNHAIISAVREIRGNSEKITIVTAVYSGLDSEIPVSIFDAESMRELAYASISQKKGRGTLTLTVPLTKAGILVKLPDDALMSDNQTLLLHPGIPDVRTAVKIKNSFLSAAVRKAVEASGIGTVSGTAEAEMLFSDFHDTSFRSQQMIFEDTGEVMGTFSGPYLIDQDNPLCRGISLDGIIWTCFKKTAEAVFPAAAVGLTPLIYEKRGVQNRTVNINLLPEKTTLFAHTSWPALIYNMLEYTRLKRPGLLMKNCRCGDQIQISTGNRNYQLLTPDGKTITLPYSAEKISFVPEIPGEYQLTSDKESYSFAAGSYSEKESDLSQAQTGSVSGSEKTPETRTGDYYLAQILLISGLLLLFLHQFIISEKGFRI